MYKWIMRNFVGLDSEMAGVRDDCAPGLVLRRVSLPDLPGIAAIHRRAFPESLITKLGPEAARRLYESLLQGPHECAATGAFLEGRLAAFCFGGVFRGPISYYLKTNTLYLGFRVLVTPESWIRRKFRNKLISGLRLLCKPGPPCKGISRPVGCSLLSIAVDPDVQGRGIGALLVRELENYARSRGFHEMHLTVYPDNAGAVRVYERAGWRRVGEAACWCGRMEKSV